MTKIEILESLKLKLGSLSSNEKHANKFYEHIINDTCSIFILITNRVTVCVQFEEGSNCSLIHTKKYFFSEITDKIIKDIISDYNLKIKVFTKVEKDLAKE